MLDVAHCMEGVFIAEKFFKTACVEVNRGNGEKAHVVVKKGGKKQHIKKGVVKDHTPRTAEQREAVSDLKVAAHNAVKTMKHEGCNMSEFFANVKGTPIETDNFSWESSLNFSANRNKILSLSPDVTEQYGRNISTGDAPFIQTVGKPIVTELRKGFVVEGKNTEKFLEEKLAILGLNEREANEFIIYWLPQMENNKANVIYFATKEYENESTLMITPKPIQTIRVMMLWQPLQSTNAIFMQQEITPIKRQKGFLAVEWGGSKVNIFRKITP